MRNHVQEEDLELFFRILTSLMRRGADVNSQNHAGETPLHQACFRGREQGIVWLLENGAKVNLVNQ